MKLWLVNIALQYVFELRSTTKTYNKELVGIYILSFNSPNKQVITRKGSIYNILEHLPTYK